MVERFEDNEGKWVDTRPELLRRHYSLETVIIHANVCLRDWGLVSRIKNIAYRYVLLEVSDVYSV